jgi:preprotein translocase subunit SecA
VISETVELALSPEIPRNEWDWDALQLELSQYYPTSISRSSFEGAPTVEDVVEFSVEDGATAYEKREEELGAEILRQVERSVMLSVIDNKWREHLSEMDYLRAGIGLRAMGQRDPLSEYQREAFDMFTEMVDSVKRDAVKYLFHVELSKPKSEPQRVAPLSTGGPVKQASSDKVGRNDPCPCGSGKKYKRCHGAA